MTTRVERGAALLDEAVPDWFNRVDPKTLDMDNTEHCVVAQATGDNFYRGCEKLGVNWRWKDNHSDAQDYGFCPSGNGVYATRQWKREIRRRRAA